MRKNHNKFLWSIALCVQFLIFGGAWGQVANYSFTSSSGTYTAISGGTVVRSGSSLDFGGATVTLPTAFPFNGSSITSLRVNDDGYVALGVTSFTNSTQPIASTNAATGIVAALACDLMDANAVGTSPEIRWQQIGNEIIFQWNDFARYTSLVSTEIFDFQIRLNTSNGQIVIVYSNFSTVNSSTSYTPQVGLRGSTTADFNSRRLTTSVPTATPSWSNTAAAATTGNNVRFTSTSPAAFPSTGLTFTWTPPTPCTGTPTPGAIATNASQNICSGTTPSVLTVTGSSTGVSGISFQWEQSTDNVTWVNASGGSGATTASFTPPSFGGTTIYYRCKVTCTSSTLFAVTNTATIAPPSNPTTQASSITFSSISYTGLTASWTNGNGNRRVVYVSDAAITDPTNSTGASALTANTTYSGTGQKIVFDGTGTSVTVTGLNLATTYYVKVIEYTRCGTTTFDNYYNVTTGTNSNSATTSAATPVPWSEGFASTTLPTNWVSTAGFVSSTTAVNPALGSNYYYVNLWSSATTASITSPILGSIPTNYRFTVKYKLANYSLPYAPPAIGSGNFIVAISIDNGVTYTNVETISNNAVAGWQDYILNLGAYVGQNIRIRITGNWISGDYYLAFDEFKIEAIPSCLAPSSPIVSAITNVGATLSWTAPSPAPGSGYEVYYSTTNTAPTAGTTATETVATGTILAIAGLTANTTYYAWVRSNCGSADVSTWVASASFTTLQIPATLPYSDDLSSNNYTFVNGSQTNKWVFGSSVGNTGSSIYVSNDNGVTNAYSNSSSTVTNAFRDITIPVGTTSANFSFDWIANGESGYDYLRAWIVPVSFEPSAGSEITSGSGRIQVGGDFIGQTTWQTYSNATLDVSSFANTTMRLVFEWSNDGSVGDNPPGAIDNVNLSIPLCLAPSAPIVSALSNVGATLSWTAPSTAPGSGYEVYYSTTTTAPTAGTTASAIVATGTSLAITGLTANTTYFAWVRSKCGSGDVSSWVASTSFSTLCDPITSLPWTEGFEGVTVGNSVVGSSTSLPTCWNSQSTQWSSTDATTYNTSQTGSKYIRYAWNTTDAFIWTPGFQLIAGISYDFSFYAQGDGFTTWENDVFVNSSVSSVGAIQLSPTYSPTGPGSAEIQAYSLVTRNFVPTTSGIYYFAIRGNELTGDPWYMAFDDFSLELSPSPLPTELVSFAANCEDNNTVAVNWTTASEHNSDYFIVEKSRDGVTWNELKKIEAAGNSSQLINYSVADASDINGTVYYRLSQFDIDGASKVYDIVSTNCSAEKELEMVAYPNPSNGQFTVKIENAVGGSYTLGFTDMQGKAIEQQNIQLETGTTVVKLNPIGLKPGVYLLQLVNASTIEKQLKLVVN
jgi:hypothetical protein